MADVIMPQLGETVTEGTVTRWYKKVGDPVAADEVLFEVSTDKVDSEVPSPASGYLAEILVPEGETVPVGTRLAVITAEPPAAAGAVPSGAPAPAAAPPPPPPPPPPAAPPPPPPPPAAPPPPPPPPPAPPARPAAAGPAAGNGGRVLSPVVRRLIAEHNLDPATIPGTGPGGRITREDVLAVIEATRAGAPRPAGEPATAPPPPAAPSAAPPRAVTAPAAPAEAAPAGAAAPTTGAGRRGDEVVPFTNIRRRTAEHMVRSKQTSAHTLCVIEVDYARIERVRAAHRESFRAAEGFALTYLPFIARAVIDAIREWPHVNASVGDDALIVHHDIHLGIAVDLDHQGLIVPVIHDAADKRLRAIARAIVDLATRARAKKLSADDIAGGTFTITNPGPFGTFLTAPIINQPQVAILSTDGVKKRPVAVELPDGTDAVAVHPVGNLALSFDHRVIDGAYAAAFLKTVKDICETRDWEAELT